MLQQDLLARHRRLASHGINPDRGFLMGHPVRENGGVANAPRCSDWHADDVPPDAASLRCNPLLMCQTSAKRPLPDRPDEGCRLRPSRCCLNAVLCTFCWISISASVAVMLLTVEISRQSISR